MPLIDIVPATQSVENQLAEHMGTIRPLIKKAVDSVLHFGEADILVNLKSCNTRDSDPMAADAVLYLEALDRPSTEAKLDTLRDSIQEAWAESGVLSDIRLEVWPRIITSSWCLIQGPEVIETANTHKGDMVG